MKHPLVTPIHLVAQVDAARMRLEQAAKAMARMLDDGPEPSFHDAQELEAAAIDLGRLLNKVDA